MRFPARQGPGATDNAPCGHSPTERTAGALQVQDSRLALNRLFLSGILAADPVEDKGRDGEPITLLLVAFPAPDASNAEQFPVASCEIEVPRLIFEKHGGRLQPGESIFITGQLSGGGGVIATEVQLGPPPDEATRRDEPRDDSP